MNTAKKEFSEGSGSRATVIMALILILSAVVLSIGYAIWNGYKNQIMYNHKEELLLTSHVLAGNMESSLNEYLGNLDFLCQQYEKTGSWSATADFYRDYLLSKNSPEADILFDAPGVTESILGTVLDDRQLVTQISDERTVWLASDPAGRHLYQFCRLLPDGQALSLVIDADQCYKDWISGIQIGTSGYVMVKNSSGIILMHPEASQWGIHVISGRKERYPDLDLSSLEQMVNAQNRGEDGVSEYYSYWWMEQPLVMVRKISGYAPVHLGEDFWVVSSVVDYDDYYAPVEEGFSRISILFAGSLTVSVILLLFLSTLLLDRRRSRQEITTLRALNERLETIHRMEERIGHQQRLQVIGTMTGGIAHEFNNLLTPIMGYSEILMMELPEDSEPYDNALEIYDASEKAREVVRQLSTLSRKNVETVFKKEDPGMLLQRVLKMMRSVCPASICLEAQISPLEDSPVLCNATQINQVLLNLFLNAVHAIRERQKADGEDLAEPDGVIRLLAQTISLQDLAARPQMQNRELSDSWNRYLQIQVTDDGCGMDPDVLRQIFNPFFTTKKAGEGTGLGLAVAEQIILSHRGFIYAESSPGKGSVFTVCLPVMPTKAESPEQELFPVTAEKKGIIIADDNAKILDLLGTSFSRRKVDVTLCRTRTELKAILDKHSADVLLIDESLEDGSGIDFCMSIQGLYPSMIKIVMADYPTHMLLEAQQHRIIDGYLLKPFSDIDAVEEIRRCRAG